MAPPEVGVSRRVTMKRPVNTLEYWQLTKIAITTPTELIVITALGNLVYHGSSKKRHLRQG